MLRLEHPMAVLTALAGLCGLIFWLAESPRLARVFRYLPALLLIVFLPATLGGLGVLPRSSPTYDALRDYALPFGLLLMVVTTDVRAVLRVGGQSLAVMLFGTAGVVIGALAVFALIHGQLPAEAWKMFAAITASWIGGGANFAAVSSAVAMPPALVGPAIVVDATISFVWLGFVLLAASYQHVLARFYVPDPRIAATLAAHEAHPAEGVRRIDYPHVLIVLGVGLPLAAVSMWTGRQLWAAVADPDGGGLALVMNEYTLGILMVTFVGIALSFTPLRRLEALGAPAIGYAAQFLFFASLGAQADFSAIVAMPVLVVGGVAWILTHGAVLLFGARLLRAPLPLIAIASIANVSGPSTAAVVGAQYGRSWAALGVLLGLFGHLIGTFAGLACGIVLAAIAR